VSDRTHENACLEQQNETLKQMRGCLNTRVVQSVLSLASTSAQRGFVGNNGGHASALPSHAFASSCESGGKSLPSSAEVVDHLHHKIHSTGAHIAALECILHRERQLEEVTVESLACEEPILDASTVGLPSTLWETLESPKPLHRLFTDTQPCQTQCSAQVTNDGDGRTRLRREGCAGPNAAPTMQMNSSDTELAPHAFDLRKRRAQIRKHRRPKKDAPPVLTLSRTSHVQGSMESLEEVAVTPAKVSNGHSCDLRAAAQLSGLSPPVIPVDTEFKWESATASTTEPASVEHAICCPGVGPLASPLSTQRNLPTIPVRCSSPFRKKTLPSSPRSYYSCFAKPDELAIENTQSAVVRPLKAAPATIPELIRTLGNLRSAEQQRQCEQIEEGNDRLRLEIDAIRRNATEGRLRHKLLATREHAPPVNSDCN